MVMVVFSEKDLDCSQDFKNISTQKRRFSHEIKKLSKKIGLPMIEIYSAATFYSMLSVEPKGKKVVRICNSPSCYLNGSLNILDETKKILGVDVGETTKDKKFTLEKTSCIGCCDKAPAIMINDELITDLTKDKLKELLK